jgi:hypothetical protein
MDPDGIRASWRRNAFASLSIPMMSSPAAWARW